MNRRNFFARFSQAVAGAVLAAHVDFGSLIPKPPVAGLQPLMYGNLEPLVQPLYDVYAVASYTTVPRIALFAIPEKVKNRWLSRFAEASC